MSAAFSVPKLPAELHKILEEVTQQYNDVQSDQSSRAVAFADIIEEACKKFGFCEERHFHCKQIGMHPFNRDGEGVHPKRANTRVEVLHIGGVSIQTLQKGLVAIEDNPMTKRIAKFTVSICEQGPEYARYVLQEVKGGTVAGTHCNHGFAQVHDETPCDIPRISVSGKMSQEKCFSDPGMRKVVTGGATYTFYSWPVEYHFPIIPKILQSAYTTVTQVGEGVNVCRARGTCMHECAGTLARTRARACRHAHARAHARTCAHTCTHTRARPCMQEKAGRRYFGRSSMRSVTIRGGTVPSISPW